MEMKAVWWFTVTDLNWIGWLFKQNSPLDYRRIFNQISYSLWITTSNCRKGYSGKWRGVFRYHFRRALMGCSGRGGLDNTPMMLPWSRIPSLSAAQRQTGTHFSSSASFFIHVWWAFFFWDTGGWAHGTQKTEAAGTAHTFGLIWVRALTRSLKFSVLQLFSQSSNTS